MKNNKKSKVTIKPVVLPNTKEDDSDMSDLDMDLTVPVGGVDTGVYRGWLHYEPTDISIKYEIECRQEEKQKNNRLCKMQFVLTPNTMIGQGLFSGLFPITFELKNGIKLKFGELSDGSGTMLLDSSVETKSPRDINNWDRRSRTISLTPDINESAFNIVFNSQFCVNKDTWKKIHDSFLIDKEYTITKVDIGELMFPDKKAEYDKEFQKLLEYEKQFPENNRPLPGTKSSVKLAKQSKYEGCEEDTATGGKVIAKLNPVERQFDSNKYGDLYALYPKGISKKITMLGEKPPVIVEDKKVIAESVSVSSNGIVTPMESQAIEGKSPECPPATGLFSEVIILKEMVGKLQRQIESLTAVILLSLPAKKAKE